MRYALDPCLVVLLRSHSRSAGPEGGVANTSAEGLAVGIGLDGAGVGALSGSAGTARATCCPGFTKGGSMSS